MYEGDDTLSGMVRLEITVFVDALSRMVRFEVNMYNGGDIGHVW